MLPTRTGGNCFRSCLLIVSAILAGSTSLTTSRAPVLALVRRIMRSLRVTHTCRTEGDAASGDTPRLDERPSGMAGSIRAAAIAHTEQVLPAAQCNGRRLGEREVVD